MPNIPEMRQVWEPMGNASIFISNGKNPKQALDEATNDSPKPGITDNNAANLGLRFFITNLLSYHFVTDEES
jgi:hypothetical protein